MAGGGTSYACERLCDIVRLDGAEALAVYGEDFYAGMPALTVNHVGTGRAYYLATDPEERMLDDFYGGLLAAHGIVAPLEAPPEVEVAVREKGGRRLLFLLNHGAQAAQVALPAGRYRDHLADEERSGALELPPYGVALLEEAG
jgi:beta-galactosidase